MALEAGRTATVVNKVSDADTAIALGSGDVAVLGTPRVVAWCEAATVAAVARELEPGVTTVGTAVDVRHVAPTRVGSEVAATALLQRVDRRTLTFGVEATEGDTVIATGTITRVIVDIERFLA